MVIPHSQMFAPRSFAHEATRRAVRALYYHCGVPVQAISEYMIDEYLGKAKLFIVPSPRVLTDKCWSALLNESRREATVSISGAIDLDDHWLPAPKMFAEIAKSHPVTESEVITINTNEYLVRYESEKMQRIEKAVVERPVSPLVFEDENGGKIVWSTLPLELGDSMPALVAFYRLALAEARVAPIFTASPQTPGVLILPSVFRDVVLYTFVSELDRDTRMQVTHLVPRTRFNVMVPAQRSAMVLIDRKTGRVLATDKRS